MEVTMPWFPDFVGAAELARREGQLAGRADPVAQYLKAIERGDSQLLQTVWPGQVVINDPLVGEVRGHKELQHFVSRNQSWLAEHHARTETVATTSVGQRAVVELLATLEQDGRSVFWPIAVVAESPDDRSVVFRTYCSTWPHEGHRHQRPPILNAEVHRPNDVVGRYLTALDAGDIDRILQTFQSDGYVREPIGPRALHRGTDELREYFLACFGAGGGPKLEPCEITDDGERCALEYNCVRWGSHDIPAQAGIAVFARGADGLLAAVRVYDDVEPPATLLNPQPKRPPATP
jgi:ketosteroid isomerase-like protein